MGNVGAVFVFEWKRSLTVPRMAWWLVLAGFPVFIIGLIRMTIRVHTPMNELQRGLWLGFLFALGPMLVTMLGTMLWLTPAVSAELERRSWVYLSVRPNGGTAVLLGKYLAAVTWVIPPVLVGLAIAVPISGIRDGWEVWCAMVGLVCLSTPAYAAVYLLLGTVMPRRAMVLAVGYSLLFELVISYVPAVINKLTVQHHLLALMMRWCQFELPPAFQSGAAALIGNSPTSEHVLALMLYPPILVAISVFILRANEFSSSAESDV